MYEDKDLTDEARAKKLADARAKYGKKFAHEVPVKRKSCPSFVLRELMRRANEEKKPCHQAAPVDDIFRNLLKAKQ